MKYMLIFHGFKDDFDLRADPVKGPVFWGEFMAYVRGIQDSGIMIAGAGLEVPETGKIVRVRDGKNQVQDGPYAETKESVAGFFLIQVPNLENRAGLGAALPLGDARLGRSARGFSARWVDRLSFRCFICLGKPAARAKHGSEL
jgi:hypothetical protein